MSAYIIMPIKMSVEDMMRKMQARCEKPFGEEGVMVNRIGPSALKRCAAIKI